jgi:lysophospholipase L1-like esterase
MADGMGIGMAREAGGRRLKPWLAALVAAGTLVSFVAGAQSQGSGDPAPQQNPLPPVAKECGEAHASETPLPNTALALQRDKKITILAIGASSVAVLGGSRGETPLLEQILERTIKGVDVEIINRGFSGELAEAAGQRLKIEVALNHPNIVLWQVGTNDAFAQVPVGEFEASVTATVRWLKEHNIDVILVGLHYLKHLTQDQHYQAIRSSLRRIIAAENVIRIGRYEAMEVLDRTMRQNARLDPSDFGLTEQGYNCMAQYMARAITVGIYARKPKGPAAVPRG